MTLTLEELEVVAARCEVWPKYYREFRGITPEGEGEDELPEVLKTNDGEYG